MCRGRSLDQKVGDVGFENVVVAIKWCFYCHSPPCQDLAVSTKSRL